MTGKAIRQIALLSIFLTLCASCKKSSSKVDAGYDMVEVNYPLVSLVDYFPDPIIDPRYIPAKVENYNQFLKDSVDIYNALDYLYPMLRYKSEETFDYPFDCADLKIHLTIEKTPDNKLKFYKYQERLVPTTLIQYKDSVGKVQVDIFNPQYKTGQEVLASYQRHNARREEDCPGISSGSTISVDEITTSDGVTIYLTVQYAPTGVAREKDVYVTTMGYVDGRPQKINIFENEDSIFSSINVYLETYHSDQWKTHDKLFKYEPNDQKLYIPLIEDDEFNDKYIVYQFNGRRFVKQGFE